MRKLATVLARVQDVVCGVLLAAMVVVVFLQVLFRRVFLTPGLWTQEASIFGLSWSVFVGSALALRTGAHYIVDVWPGQWRGVHRLLDGFASVVMAVVGYVLLREGWAITVQGWTRYSQPSGFRMSWYFACLPVAGASMLIYMADDLIAIAKKRMTRKGVSSL
jgi:TRAP-type C4-dicarboxylate transport system permease small subunit